MENLWSKIDIILQAPLIPKAPCGRSTTLPRVHSQPAHGITAKAHLTDLMSTTILDLVISEDGGSVSREERHLAKAVVRGANILVLNDAMAGCDVETDHLIQSTIPAAFSQCKMLMIAHQLDTVASCCTCSLARLRSPSLVLYIYFKF